MNLSGGNLRFDFSCKTGPAIVISTQHDGRRDETTDRARTILSEGLLRRSE